MKKKYALLLAVIILPVFTMACDICGCGVGNSYIGILPDFHKHIFGIRYRYNSMYTHLGVGGSTTYLTTKEMYNTVEAWGGWNIGEKTRIILSVPYGVNTRKNQGESNSKNGLGDITLSGYYQLLNSRRTVLNQKLFVQSLWIGAGVKFATGKYNSADKNVSGNNVNLFQLGTGSNDFNVGLMYDARLQDFGINVSSNYKISTVNKDDYRYGNKLTINTQAYYKCRINKKIMLAPNAGIQYENGSTDTDNNFKVTASGGRLLLGTIGVETVLGRFAVGANVQTPLSQNLANGIVKANGRFMLHVAIAL
ncbi:transporter [Ferruginibacter sp. SUN002]|uniref:transporter n=1 Tax=Ferruginibacter sp. SUN002 TaxID=2937789 RepID=UPI003D35D339